MKAVILAAGEGTRLEPLTNVRPKPMVPVANKPILEHVLEAVIEAGIDEIILVVGYKRQRIQNYFGDGNDWGVDITYVIQDTQLGSGHALLEAEAEIGSDLVVLNGDQIVEPSAIEGVIEKRNRTGHTAMAVSRSAETQLYGVLNVEDGVAVDLLEKPETAAIDSDVVNAGVYAFGPEIFAALRDTESEGELGLTTALATHLDDHPVEIVGYDGVWFDITRPWDLLTANGYLLDTHAQATHDTSIHESAAIANDSLIGANSTVHPNATILRETALGANISIGANTVIENSIVMDDATIGPSTTIRDCIVGANATIGPGCIAEGGETTVVLEETVHRDVRFGGIVGDNAEIRGGATVAPGARLGNDSTVESRCVLEGTYEPGSTVRRG